MRDYGLNTGSKGAGYTHSHLTVPRRIAELLPEGARFACELTEEGILYRPVAPEPAVDDVLPAWVADGLS